MEHFKIIKEKLEALRNFQEEKVKIELQLEKEYIEVLLPELKKIILENAWHWEEAYLVSNTSQYEEIMDYFEIPLKEIFNTGSYHTIIRPFWYNRKFQGFEIRYHPIHSNPWNLNITNTFIPYSISDF